MVQIIETKCVFESQVLEWSLSPKIGGQQALGNLKFLKRDMDLRAAA